MKIFLNLFTLIFSIVTLLIVIFGAEIGIPIKVIRILPSISLILCLINIFNDKR